MFDGGVMGKLWCCDVPDLSESLQVRGRELQVVSKVCLESRNRARCGTQDANAGLSLFRGTPNQFRDLAGIVFHFGFHRASQNDSSLIREGWSVDCFTVIQFGLGESEVIVFSRPQNRILRR